MNKKTATFGALTLLAVGFAGGSVTASAEAVTRKVSNTEFAIPAETTYDMTKLTFQRDQISATCTARVEALNALIAKGKSVGATANKAAATTTDEKSLNQ